MADLGLNMLFPNSVDQDNHLTAFASIGHDDNDLYKDLTTEEKEALNEKFKTIAQKKVIELDTYIASTAPIEPDLNGINHSSAQFQVVKKFSTYNVGDVINISDLSNIEFLLKFNIVNPI